MILRIARFVSPAVFVLSVAACKPAVQSATDAPVAEAAAAPAQPADAGEPIAGLRALAAIGVSVDASRVDAYLDRHFQGQCADADPRLSFDRICQHYPAQAAKDDPSPWPDVVLGIKDGRIVSAVLTGAAEAPGAGWRCAAAVGFEGMRLCHVETVPEADRARWSAEWIDYFASGD